MTYLPIILAGIFFSVAINSLLKRVGIPTVIGYIATGIAISAVFALHHDHYHELSEIAEFGIVFLMFTIGLEFSFRQLVAMRKEVMLYGSLQMGFSALLFGLAAHLFGMAAEGAIITGLALGLSSTAIVLKALNESGDVQTPYGRKAVGILIFQDLAVIPILLTVTIFSSENSDIFAMLKTILLDAVVVGIIIYLVGKYMIEWLLGWVTRANSSEIFLGTVLFLVVGSAELAHLFGFTYSLGAFLAGMMLAETHYKYQIEAELVPFRDLLLGLFFVTVGMQIDLQEVAHSIVTIFLVALVVMVVKFGVIFLFMRFFTRPRVALKTALALAQVGEFALAVFALAQANRLIGNTQTQILLSAVVISMILSVFILSRVRDIADRFIPEPEPEIVKVESTGFSDHVIVCGFGPLGRKVAVELKRQGVTYLILEHDIQRMEWGRKMGEPIFFANAANEEVLKHFDVGRASAVIVAVDHIRHLRLICEALMQVAPHANVVVKVHCEEEAEMIRDLNIDHILVESREMARLLVAEAMRCRLGIAQPKS
ncbi:cation:proton antiporter [Hydrogenimonas cancrithermarum]|uniref:Potassium transporter n=1 Tax=Hydrogenimonas cancrithermarum TaxID=2993563 RepID=A0ABN6WVM5_9BACT|nr:cation:proton antiporter [Hydrogenimonas cancrithermarum]BDY12916.1 potassium transporter [Hydrogenimonas cancrithermarum]BDY13033.1 potassium transporter [Hydrogenimonas cancrithermarum]